MADDEEPHFLFSAFCSHFGTMSLTAAEKIEQFRKRLKKKSLGEEMLMKNGKDKKHWSLIPVQCKVQRKKKSWIRNTNNESETQTMKQQVMKHPRKS